MELAQDHVQWWTFILMMLNLLVLSPQCQLRVVWGGMILSSLKELLRIGNTLVTFMCISLGSEWGVTGLPMLLQPSWHDVIPAAVTADQAASHSTPTKLEELQQNLRSGWTVHIAQDGRLYYCKWAKTFVFWYFKLNSGLAMVLWTVQTIHCCEWNSSIAQQLQCALWMKLFCLICML